MKKIVGLVFFIVIAFTARAQLNLDSLEKSLPAKTPSKEILIKYLEIAANYNSEEKPAKELILQWISEKTKNGKVDSVINAATVSLGRLRYESGKIPEATELFSKVIASANEQAHYPILCEAYRLMAQCFYEQENSDKVDEYYNKSLQLATKYNYKMGIADANLGIYGFIMNKQTKLPGSDTMHLIISGISKAISDFEELKDTSRIPTSYAYLAQIYLDFKMFDSAIIAMDKAKRYVFPIAENKKSSYYYFILGRIYLNKAKSSPSNRNDFFTAIKMFQLSRMLGKKDNNKNEEAMCLDRLSSCYRRLNMPDSAYYYFDEFKTLNKQIVNEESVRATAGIERKYEKLKKDKEIISLNASNQQKSTLNKILIGAAVVLLFIGILGYRNFKSRQKLQQTQIVQLEKDKQLLAVDAMLKGQEEERSRLAKDLHDGLGGMLSGVKLSFVNMKENMIMDAPGVQSFEASILQLDNTIAELRKVAHNLMPEALVKFGLKNAVLDFCNSMQLSSKTKIIFEQMGTDRQLSNTADLYIYRIIQELINNALKHAKPNQVLVQLTKADKNILLTVENDGKGFDPVQLKNADGIGLKSVQQRVDYFTGKMDISSTETGGTSVNIELNV